MTVLDASAVLALVHDEPGAALVAEALASARLGAAANLAARGTCSSRRDWGHVIPEPAS